MKEHPMIPAARPRFVEDIYTPDEQAVLFDIIRTRGPWRLIAAQHFSSAEEFLAVAGGRNHTRMSAPALSDFLTPTFRGYIGNYGTVLEQSAHDIYYSRRLLDMIKSMHGASYAVPNSFLFNLRAPAHSFDAGHFDSPSWRGMDKFNTPTWLLSVMAKSGLFDRWELRSGQVIAYYYDSDVDGGFTYWPEGPDAPPARYPAPFRNSGILTHNEKMFHRGEASGPRHMRSVPDLQLDSAIHGVGDSEWAICNGDEEIARYHDRHMRFLFHYGAFVFDDMAELRRYFEHTDDLDLDTAVAIFTDDLRGRGIRCPEPTDPLHDRDFVSVLNSAYAMAPAEYPAEAPLDVPNTA
ncbi:hypothetical protein [Rhodococcus phenolicus]|uniref:hypothetical protein n=1 Tax=Rhodococcus phenolicus TaxID=263849 RepID=UPI00083033FE|nr:hypothetical protein [Rhodococcus phenolicus]